MRGEQHDQVAIGVSAAEVVELRMLAPKVDVGVTVDRDRGQSRLLALNHVLPRLFGRDDLRIHLLHLDVAAAVVAVMMRIDDVTHGLIRNLLQLRHDVVMIDFKFVVDEHHTVIGDQCGRISGNDIIVNDVQIIFNLHKIQLCGLRTTLRVSEPHGTGQKESQPQAHDRTFMHPKAP